MVVVQVYLYIAQFLRISKPRHGEKSITNGQEREVALSMDVQGWGMLKSDGRACVTCHAKVNGTEACLAGTQMHKVSVMTLDRSKA